MGGIDAMVALPAAPSRRWSACSQNPYRDRSVVGLRKLGALYNHKLRPRRLHNQSARPATGVGGTARSTSRKTCSGCPPCGDDTAVNFRALRNPRRDMVWVAAAGPGMNIVLAAVAALLFHLVSYLPDTVA
jgi:hypothetical protein